MMRFVRYIFAVVALAVVLPVVGVEKPPFRLPIAAKVTQRDAKGDTWRENGFVKAPFASAKGQFACMLSREGWRFIHDISLAHPNGRTLSAWQRGQQEIVLMLWREDPSKTGFSWGISDRQKNKRRKSK